MSETKVRLRRDVFDDLCRARGLGRQEDIAAKLGMSPSQLDKVRAGRSQPGSKFIDAAQDLLGVPYAALFTSAPVAERVA